MSVTRVTRVGGEDREPHVGIVSAAVIRLRGFAADPAEAFWQLLGCLWQLLWALYLGSKSTREAFLAALQQRGDEKTS